MMLKISHKNRILHFVLAIVMFIYIFSPPLLPINMHIMVEGISIIYLICIIIKHKGLIILDSKIISLAIAFIPFLIYETIMVIIFSYSNNSFSEAYINSYTLIMKIWIRILIACTAYYVFIVENKFDLDEQLKVYMIVMFIQIFFVFLTFMFPGVRDAVLNMITTNSSENVIIDVIGRLGDRRGYGLSENLFDSFGFILSLFLSITYILWLEKGNKIFIFLTIALLVACALNARTGVLLSILSIGVATILYKKKPKQIRNIFIMSIIIPFLIIWIIRILGNIVPDTVDWLRDGMDEIINLFKYGEYTGTFGGLKEDTFWPQSLAFGSGAGPETLVRRSSDVGYVQCVWRYGIIGTVLLIGGYIYGGCLGIKNASHIWERVLMFIFIILVLIYLLKIFFINNLGANFVIYTCIIGVLNEQKKEKDFILRS